MGKNPNRLFIKLYQHHGRIHSLSKIGIKRQTAGVFSVLSDVTFHQYFMNSNFKLKDNLNSVDHPFSIILRFHSKYTSASFPAKDLQEGISFLHAFCVMSHS
ncbi:hypothetical protein CEXT_651451 [Caerostris extrusa]|uniref:Uncharacterized protein n=1 Tax=Caerostris extrusa TaxID=172846 RepID=A0AAV4T970_CAEEX|nr:hypothetical protein CEXT_651451 [Caerostris extrusa]